MKELPTLKDMDFLNKNQKVYIGEEEKKVFLEKLKRDVEVSRVLVQSRSVAFHSWYEVDLAFILLGGGF